MIIDDLDIQGISPFPPENDAPLVVNPNRIKPFSVSPQCLQSVSGGHPEILQLGGFMQVLQFPARRAFHIGRKLSCRFGGGVLKQVLRQPVSEALDHCYMLS